jgi:hypothetical protein
VFDESSARNIFSLKCSKVVLGVSSHNVLSGNVFTFPKDDTLLHTSKMVLIIESRICF